MTLLTLSVFGFIEDYAQELGKLEQLPSELDVEESLVQFATQFFSQFFSETLGHQILAINAEQAVEVAVAAKLAQKPALDLIVAAFREYCQDYETILGEHYDRGGERTAFQREFIPELLRQIGTWAEACEREDVFEAAADALTLIEGALDTVSDPDDQDEPE